jgi:hypothetical protein
LYNEAAVYRGAAAADAGITNELHLIDIGLFVRYLEAVDDKDRSMAAILSARFRPEARPAIAAWLAKNPLSNPNAPKSPFVMPEYQLASDAHMKAELARSDRAFTEAGEANERSDDFLRLTVVFSTVAFLGGMSTKFKFPLHIAMVAVGTIALVYGVVRLFVLPFL